MLCAEAPSEPETEPPAPATPAQRHSPAADPAAHQLQLHEDAEAAAPQTSQPRPEAVSPAHDAEAGEQGTAAHGYVGGVVPRRREAAATAGQPSGEQAASAGGAAPPAAPQDTAGIAAHELSGSFRTRSSTDHDDSPFFEQPSEPLLHETPAAVTMPAAADRAPAAEQASTADEAERKQGAAAAGENSARAAAGAAPQAAQPRSAAAASPAGDSPSSFHDVGVPSFKSVAGSSPGTLPGSYCDVDSFMRGQSSLKAASSHRHKAPLPAPPHSSAFTPDSTPAASPALRARRRRSAAAEDGGATPGLATADSGVLLAAQDGALRMSAGGGSGAQALPPILPLAQPQLEAEALTELRELSLQLFEVGFFL